MKKLAYIVGVFVIGAGLSLAQNSSADQNGKDDQAPRSENNQGQPVTGKAQSNHGRKAVGVTTTGTTGQNTPGAETEAGVEQQPGGNSDVPHTAPAKGSKHAAPANAKTAAPHNENDPGQSAKEADVNAQAASRAEITPGSTLGVNATNSSPKPGAASAAQASDLPQTDQTSQSASAKKKSPKKSAQANKSTQKKTANSGSETAQPK